MYLNVLTNATFSVILRLTLTWDVFKFIICFLVCGFIDRLTLTWDVFKYGLLISLKMEMYRLTLTWDVFKLTK